MAANKRAPNLSDVTRKPKRIHVPFAERLLCTKKEGMEFLSIGPSKWSQLVAEGRIRRTVIGNRPKAFVASLLEIAKAGEGMVIPEPVQLARAKTKTEVAS